MMENTGLPRRTSPAYIGGGEPRKSMSGRVLVVNSDPEVLDAIGADLAWQGHHVVTTGSFAEAKRLMRESSVDVVVADVRLGAFNGLHLAAYARTAGQHVRVVITHPVADVLYEREAQCFGAVFVSEPTRKNRMRFGTAVEELCSTRAECADGE